MKRRIALILAAGLLVAAQAPKEDAAKADLAKLQGEWVMTSKTYDGQETPAEDLKAFRRKIEGNKYAVTITKGDNVQTIKGTFTLDPTKKPKVIDVKPDEVEAIKGIYEVDGDTQKLCMAAHDAERPAEFASKEGTRQTLIVWKRVKP